MRPKYTKVRARSANEGSGTTGWSLPAPVPACFLTEEEDIAGTFWQFKGNLTWPKGLASGKSHCGAQPTGKLDLSHLTECFLRAKRGSSKVRPQKRIPPSVGQQLGALACAEHLQ